MSETAQIPLRRKDGAVRAYVLVDAADVEWLSRWRWCLSGDGYATRGERRDGKNCTISLHRQILGLEPGDPRQGDHINLNRLDNRRLNLRIVTGAANQQNVRSRRGARSSYRGVSWASREGKWRAQVRLNTRNHFLGYFDAEEAAAEAAAAFRQEHMPYATV